MSAWTGALLVLCGGALSATTACMSDSPPLGSTIEQQGGDPASGGQSIGGAHSGGSGTGAWTTGGAGTGGSTGGSGAGFPTGGAGAAGSGGAITGGASPLGGTGGAGTGGSGSGSSSPEFAAVYAPENVVVFELTIPEACRQALRVAPSEYCEGSMVYRASVGGPVAVSLANVGIKLKGQASFRTLNQKAAFKIKVDEFVPDQRFFDLRRLTLNNMVQDASMMHERIGYRLFRELGVPAPLCNHARVYVNGSYYGLYANVQAVDDELFEHVFDTEAGNLYDILNYDADLEEDRVENFELETNGSTSTNADLLALISAVNGPDATFYEDAGLMLDWTEWLAAGALQAMIADWDGYFGAHNNFLLYHEVTSNRFLLIPWGIDQTFGATDSHPFDPLYHLDYSIDGSSSDRDNGIVFRRCQASSMCWEEYLDALEGALAVWERQDFAAEVAAMRTQLADAVAEDDRREHSDEDIEELRASLQTFLAERPGRVRAQLSAYGRNPP